MNVQVVNLYFNVKDKRGALIPNLKKEDFLVSEDGKPQTIKYFAADSNQPLTLGLLIDTSGSQTRVLPMEKEVGAAFLRDVLTPKDLAFLINFDIAVDLIQDYTNDAARLRRAMEKTQINDGGGSGAGGIAGAGQGTIPVSRPKGTLLYDAVYLASNEKLQKEAGRKALVLLTDGGDQGSDETLGQCHRSRATIRGYRLRHHDCRPRLRLHVPGRLPRAPCTNWPTRPAGASSMSATIPRSCAKPLTQIGTELRSQYMIGYVPTNTAADGKYRKIEVKTANPDYKLQARKGYYAPKE